MFINQSKVLLIILILVSYFMCCAKLTSADIPINKFTVKQLQEDFRQMRQTLEEDHANLYEYTEKSIMDTLFDRQYELLDSPMTLIEFFRVITPITAKIGCGHTNFWMPGEYWKPEPDKLFPIKIKLIEGKVIAAGDFNTISHIEKGSILLEINSVPVAEIIDEMKENYSADAMNENFILSQITRRFSMIYARRFGFPKKFNITYLSPGQKQQKTIEVQPANIQAVRDVVFSNFHHPELGFEIIEEKNTAIMTIRTFIYYDKVPMFKEFLENSFKELRDQKIQNLILDMRSNDGGDPFCAAPLLSFLEFEEVPYFAEPYNKYTELSEPIPQAENHFTGNLYTLIDGRCNSTNGHFCALLKYHKIGEFIGTEGGATYKCNAGKNTHIDLDNTKIMLYFGRSTYAAAVSNMDKTHGILPDHYVEQTYQDFLKGIDTVMEYTLELIGKRK